MTSEQITIEIPDQEDVLLDARRDGLPEILVANRALRDFAHRDVFCWYLAVTIDAVELIDQGMPSPADSALLFEIGDEIEATLLGARTAMDSVNVLFLSRSTWNGQRELGYYVHDPKVAHEALQSLLNGREWPRAWSYRMAEDFDWEHAGYVFRVFPAARGDA